MRPQVYQQQIPLSLYRQFVRRMPIATVDVVILSPDKKYTLVGLRKNRPAKNTWYTLGGRLAKHERLASRATRVLRQEAGIRVAENSLHFLGVMNEIFSDSPFGLIKTHNVNVFYGLTLRPLPIHPDAQHERIGWLPINANKIHLNARKKIQQAIRQL